MLAQVPRNMQRMRSIMAFWAVMLMSWLQTCQRAGRLYVTYHHLGPSKVKLLPPPMQPQLGRLLWLV